MQKNKFKEVTYRPSINNSELNESCDRLLQYLDEIEEKDLEKTKIKAEQSFITALKQCSNVEERRGLKKFFEEICKYGGYTIDMQFNDSYLLKDEVKQEVINEREKEIEASKNNSVSNKINPDYLYAQVPDGLNAELITKFTGFRDSLISADREDIKENMDKMYYNFASVISYCNSENEFNAFRNYMGELSDMGGLAKSINKGLKDSISMEHKNEFVFMKESYENDQKNKLNENKSEYDFEDVKRKLHSYDVGIQDILSDRIIDEEEFMRINANSRRIYQEIEELDPKYNDFKAKALSDIEDSLYKIQRVYYNQMSNENHKTNTL